MMRKRILTLVIAAAAMATMTGCALGDQISSQVASIKEDITFDVSFTTGAKGEETTTAAAAKDDKTIDPDLKAFLDSYEKFIDEYCAFMKKYKNANSVDAVQMMGDYANYVSKLADMERKANAYDSGKMTSYEALYYSEVMTRCSQKVLQAAQ